MNVKWFNDWHWKDKKYESFFLDKYNLNPDGKIWDLEEWVPEQLVGRTVTFFSQDEDKLILGFTDGLIVKFEHQQDCCESVYIEDICGDLSDLVGSPLTMCEVVTNVDEGGPLDDEYPDESYTWTFYKFATRKGYVTVRWYGSSNGYYSESVDIKIGEVDELEFYS